MPFQPFGFKFQVDLPLQPANAKSAIRKRLKPWFEAKSGPRGWILGPFICLWRSALNQYGPMLFGTIRSHGFGTRISGRAGSDLNGVAALVGMTGLMFAALILQGVEAATMIVPLLFILIILPLLLWVWHKDRGEAEPLVRFLEETMGGPRRKLLPRVPDVAISKALTLDVDGEIREPPISAVRIAEALQSIEDDGFLILSLAAESYIQTAAGNGGFVIERRDGGAESHMEAVRSDAPGSTWLKRDFTLDETLAALLAYASDAPMPDVIEWRPMY